MDDAGGNNNDAERRRHANDVLAEFELEEDATMAG